MFDRGGNYAQIIVRVGVERCSAPRTFCAFGAYSVEDEKKLLVTRIVSSSTARLTGTTQNRGIMLLTADEFKLFESAHVAWSDAEVLWKRLA